MNFAQSGRSPIPRRLPPGRAQIRREVVETVDVVGVHVAVDHAERRLGFSLLFSWRFNSAHTASFAIGLLV